MPEYINSCLHKYTKQNVNKKSFVIRLCMNNNTQSHLRCKQKKSSLTANGFRKHISFSKEITQYNKNMLLKMNELIYLLFQDK